MEMTEETERTVIGMDGQRSVDKESKRRSGTGPALKKRASIRGGRGKAGRS